MINTNNTTTIVYYPAPINGLELGGVHQIT